MKNTEQQQPKKTDVDKTVVKRTKKEATKSSLVLIGVVAVFSIVALCLSIYLYFHLGNLQDKLHSNKVALQEFEWVQGTVTGLESETRRLGDLLEKSKISQNELLTRLRSITSQKDQDELDWVLAEVEYLLIIATHRLALESDVSTALAAMQAALKRLQNINDPRLIDSRRQLISDINSLKSVKLIDITGLTLYLADIISRAQSLPLKAVINTPSKSKDVASTEMKEAGQLPLWKQVLATIWNELKGLVVISRDNEAAVIALLPGQEYFLYQNLRVQLESARVSVLQRDTNNLHASIGLIDEWIVDYFDTADNGVDNIRQSLRQMLALNLKPAVPDISSSLETVRALIKQVSTHDPESS